MNYAPNRKPPEEERYDRVHRYLVKKYRRNSIKKVSYDIRKVVADKRLRIKGRFIRKEDQKSIMQRIFGSVEGTVPPENTQKINKDLEQIITDKSPARRQPTPTSSPKNRDTVLNPETQDEEQTNQDIIESVNRAAFVGKETATAPKSPSN